MEQDSVRERQGWRLRDLRDERRRRPNPTNLTNDPTSADYSPEWSPNGNKIAYESNGSGNFDISVMKADGSEKKRLTTTTTGEAFPAFSPDGKKIAFVRNRGSNTEIFTKNLSTGSQQTAHQ